jgi:3'5'-cyclic nucleotide phosphodiesterase
VNCKGKGVMTTYWCEPKSAVGKEFDSRSSVSRAETELELDDAASDDTRQRLIRWNVDMFSSLLREIANQQELNWIDKLSPTFDSQRVGNSFAGKPVDEVTEVLTFPKPSTSGQGKPKPNGHHVVTAPALEQLRELITVISDMYQVHPFHNFEHCCHVAMSTRKLLSRISESGKEASSDGSAINGIVSNVISDPLVHFAMLFAALIHDVDHPGVSNSQLIKEKHSLAFAYDGKSVAEQNSIAVAWRMLMAPRFADLRACMFASELDLKRFRQIVLNAVMATDLFDKDLKTMREGRWEKSFTNTDLLTTPDPDRRASIVVDLIIQASDVSHTMQHFTIYKKWNARLLAEMYDAYQSGRLAKDPFDGWYEGELWFFDNYVIPLAQKLRECGVFGVSCDEFLDYAKDNRSEWERKGREIVSQTKSLLISRPSKEATPSLFEL